ncbi:MAG: phosphate acyltransferase PlsX [Mycoplasmataceae bacterium]|nr:phosphate acyltransferase PlsX [Mycoplasmataceae bacterium]
MKLVLDVMGTDFGPIEPINAAKDFVKKHQDVELILVGDEKVILPLIKDEPKLSCVNATDVVHTEDLIIKTMRNRETSMYKALELVKNNLADGILSGGSTAPYVVLSQVVIGNLPNINKAAFMSYIPTTTGNGMMLLDVGANLNCTGEDLYQFAIMANIYTTSVRKVNNPKVAVLNIGTEKNKGSQYLQDANELLLKEAGINYQGFCESNRIINGENDIVVTDGYTGNITLKALEGSLTAINKLMKGLYKKPWNWLGALSSLNVIKTIKHKFDYKNYAGAFVVGLQKTVVKTHGSAKYKEFSSALRMLYEAVSEELVQKIATKFNKQTEN